MNKPKKDTLKNVAKLSGIGIQLAATIFVFAYFGKWLDEKYPMGKKWFTLLFVLIGVAVSMYSVLKQVNKMNENDK